MPGLRLPGTVLQGQVLLRGVPDAGLQTSPCSRVAPCCPIQQPPLTGAQGLPVSRVRAALPQPAAMP